jgi:hypothetical protein
VLHNAYPRRTKTENYLGGETGKARSEWVKVLLWCIWPRASIEL